VRSAENVVREDGPRGRSTRLPQQERGVGGVAGAGRALAGLRAAIHTCSWTCSVLDTQRVLCRSMRDVSLATGTCEAGRASSSATRKASPAQLCAAARALQLQLGTRMDSYKRIPTRIPHPVCAPRFCSPALPERDCGSYTRNGHLPGLITDTEARSLHDDLTCSFTDTRADFRASVSVIKPAPPQRRALAAAFGALEMAVLLSRHGIRVGIRL
jgi:hypothetical protein